MQSIIRNLHLVSSILIISFLVWSCQPNNNSYSSNQSTEDPEMDRFIDSLMNEMTLQEIIGQTVQYTSGWDVTGPALNTDYTKWLKEGMVGSLLNAHGAEYTREMQRIAVEETRLGIPLLLGYDVIHGYKTIFPVNLGSAASWDLPQIELSARIAAEEASSAGLHWTFAPMVDIARDPRWGRIMEGAGEDPYLGSLIAEAYVKGFQGDDIKAKNTILSCAKHFAAYGAAQAGRDYHTVDMSERELRSTYLPPFKATVDAGVWTFMTAFNEISGVPATANKFLFRDILRDEWGFNGFVLCDYTAIMELEAHGFAEDQKDAARLAMNAGVDMDMMGSNYRKYLDTLITENKVDRQTVEDACRRILEAKYRLGLFEDPYRYSDVAVEEATIYKQDYLDAATELAAHSMVLLKNEGDILPLNTNQKVALIGPLAADEYHIIGPWAGSGDRGGKAISVKEALDERLGSNITYAKGTEINTDSEAGFAAAVRAARQADVAVIVAGEAFDMSGEAASRTNIDLPGNQKALVEAVLATGKPTVLVLMNGRPLALEWEHKNVPTILEAWWPGTMGGAAVAKVLYGEHNPSGKLPITFPVNLGQVPIYYNQKNTGRPQDDTVEPKYRSKYLDVQNEPLYPFGYGLSYTEFEYSDLQLSSSNLNEGQTLEISVNVTNTGTYDGHEVVQLYVRDMVGNVTRPLKELKGFEKIFLTKGESKTVTFSLTTEDLAFWGIDMNFTHEAGDFEVFVGGNSIDVISQKFEVQ
ncbi:MAG: beta-glucosidase BglX [Bacteroidota bacterium]